MSVLLFQVGRIFQFNVILHSSKSYMQLIAVTDIFGKTECFEEFLGNISPSYDSVEVLDPYGGEEIDFKDGAEAYGYFQKKMGLKAYSQTLLKNLKGKEKQRVTLLGFSVGASAIWAVSEELELFSNMKAICFYSSQVRNYLDVNPSILIDLYFSKAEPSYDVEEVIAKLSIKPKVQCHKTEYGHGFMNRKSKNFSQRGYTQYLDCLK